MNLTIYDTLLSFTGKPDFLDDLKRARIEFIERTGDLFESDASFERRMSLFLEWFILDRDCRNRARPIDLFRESSAAQGLSDSEHAQLDSLSHSRLTLMEFRSWRGGIGRFVDLLPKQRLRITCPMAPLGLAPGDIVECRRYEYDGDLLISDAMTFLPRDARRMILKACKLQQGSTESLDRLDFVHKISFLANRGERYSHVAPREIFKALSA